MSEGDPEDMPVPHMVHNVHCLPYTAVHTSALDIRHCRTARTGTYPDMYCTDRYVPDMYVLDRSGIDVLDLSGTSSP